MLRKTGRIFCSDRRQTVEIELLIRPHSGECSYDLVGSGLSGLGVRNKIMAGFSESLTVRILADSSQLSQELDDVISRMNSFNQQLERMGRSQRGLTSLARRLRALRSPLGQVSSMLRRVVSQVRQLSGMSVSLNVTPALRALAQLSAAISRVAAQLAALGGGGRVPGGVPAGGGNPGGGFGGGGGSQGGGRVSGGGFSGGIRGFSKGGLVSGPAGVDQVPALLSAGEFVLQRSAVDQLGGSFLEGLNRSRASSQAMSDLQAPVEQTVNQFGEITIQVSQSVDLDEIVNDLQFAGHQLRNRRG